MTHAKPIPPLSNAEIDAVARRVAEIVTEGFIGETISSRVAAIINQRIEDSGLVRRSTPNRMRQIIETVAAYSEITVEALLGTRRSRDVARPRQMVMHLAYEMTSLSLPQIGNALHRDHTTIVHGRKMVQEAIASGEAWAVEMERACRAQLEGAL